MSLEIGKSDAVRERNIEKLISEGYPPKQAVAIGYADQRRNIANRVMARKNSMEKENNTKK